MRRIRYSVAVSLDGYIAGPRSEFDWILMDPDIDFAAIVAEFDTLLVGRKSFEQMLAIGLLDKLVPAACLEQEITDLASRIEGLAPLALRAMKVSLNQLASGSERDGLVDVDRYFELSERYQA